METAESRAKLANAIRTMQANGQSAQIPSLVSAYKVKYQSTPVPAPSERDTRITQGLPVSSNRRFERTGEATPNFGGEIVRSVVKPIARLGQNLTGKIDDNGKIDSRQSNYLGTVNPVGNSGNFGKDVLDSIGVGAEIGSNLVGGTGAGAVVKTGIKGAIKQGAITGLKSGIGAGATYGLGAGLQDQKDKNVGQILGNTAIQAVKGGAIGGLAGGVLGGAVAPVLKPSILLPKSSATKAISKTENELLKIENNYQKLRKNAKFSKDGNVATRKRIAQTGVMTDATDDTGTIITDKIIPKYRALSPINNTEGVVRKNLERLGETVDLDTVEDKLLKSVYDSGLQGANLESAVNTVRKEIAGYRLRANPDGRVPLTLMHDAKIDVYNSIDFNTPAEIKAYKKTLAKGLKEVVEENSSFNVKEVNETLAPYLKDIDYLESLNGRKVKGGKLGKYSARIAGNIAGGIAGGSVGGLPGSAIGTIGGGEVADFIQGKILKNTFGRTAETALPESEILKKAVQTGNSPRLQLPAPKAGQPRVQQVSGKVINLPKRTQSTADAQSLANLKAQKIAPPSNIPKKVSISKTIPSKNLPSKLKKNSQAGFIATGYKNEGNLTTKILKDLEGKTTVSKQYILDATNRGELKQVERDITRQVLEDMTRGSDNPLIQEARKYKSFDDFEKAFSKDIKRGNYWHITEDPNFKIDANKGPRDMSSLAGGEIDKGKLMITSDLPYWAENYKGTRKYVAKIDMSDVSNSDFFQSERGMGNEFFVKNPKNAKVTKVIPMAEALKESKTFKSWLEKNVNSKEDLSKIYNQAQKSDTINVKEFADKVKSELLPLEAHTSGSSIKPNRTSADYRLSPRYENISLPAELRGKIKDYRERIYNSPIQTSAAKTHFGSAANDVTGKGYFGHTRIEDMADNKTRRVIEVQSDLYQKGNLEKEGMVKLSGLTDSQYAEMNKIKGIDEKNAYIKSIQGNLKDKVSKLQQYNDPTAHFRMIREEIKKAAQDGKTKLQFPTGETAMKIEGLGETGMWHNWSSKRLPHPTMEGVRGPAPLLSMENMKVGDTVVNRNHNITAQQEEWIITDVLGDGKFKAVPKSNIDEKAISNSAQYLEGHGYYYPSRVETFDISGKVDTNNPIYKFYEKDVQKYLNKFGGKRVVDDKGVSWIEIPITKEQGISPVDAFGKIQISPLYAGAGLSLAGVAGASAIKKRKSK